MFADQYKKPGQLKKFSKAELQAVDNLILDEQKWTELKDNHKEELKEILNHCKQISLIIDSILKPAVDGESPNKEDIKRQVDIEKHILRAAMDFVL